MASKPIIVQDTGTQISINIPKDVVKSSGIKKGSIVNVVHDLNDFEKITLEILNNLHQSKFARF